MGSKIALTSMLGLALSAGYAGKAMDELKEVSNLGHGARRGSRSYKNVKKIPKELSRHKNKLARKARKANRK